MGKDDVLIVRQRDGGLKGLINSCMHRGNAVCRADEGNIKNFMCTYHGWTYDMSGKLVGVPGFENLYHAKLDKDSLGLVEVAQIDTYKGFIFATMDPEAPPLHDYLGTTSRLSLDMIAEQGDMEVVPGIQKYVINCNWKFPTDNIFDFYHGVTHLSAGASGVVPGRMRRDNDVPLDPTKVIDSDGAAKDDGTELELNANRISTVDSITILGEYGHAIGGPSIESRLKTQGGYEWRDRPEAKKALGPIGARVGGFSCIFPNVWRNNGQLCVRVPRSPNTTELWFFSFVDKNATPEERTETVNRYLHVFGPAGLLEQEDGENWWQSTKQTNGYVSKRIPHLLKMNLGEGKIIKEGGFNRIESSTSEHPQLWTYAAWSQYITGMDWESIREATTPGDYL